MECIRCQGLMVEDNFFDFEAIEGFMWMKGWRCIDCGHAADPVIEANRCLHVATLLVRPCEERENQDEHVYFEAGTITRVAA